MSKSQVDKRSLGGLDLAFFVVQELINLGVQEFVICSGARMQPLLNVIKNDPALKVWYSFEERSAAFFALGRIRESKRPCAVVTTSGTAAGELLPACMEAFYTSLPLVLLTADRPKSYRFSNAPQTCNQENLYGVYAKKAYDIDYPQKIEWDLSAPLHLNICFEEPLRHFVDTPAFKPAPFTPRERAVGSYEKLESFLSQVTHPLVVVSTLDKDQGVKEYLLKLAAPVYFEGVSQLREDHSLAHLSVNVPDLKEYDGVLRIGGVPTHRLWRDLEDLSIPVLSITEHPFSGLSRGEFIHANLKPFFQGAPAKFFGKLGKKMEPSLTAEEKVLRSISEWIPDYSLVYLGNSLPIREWDKAATYKPKHLDIQASRGLNGIDGQISTFLGLCREERHNVGIFGDLTTLYDLSALWFLQAMSAKNVTIIVINNSGGMIFDKMFGGVEEMLNRHQLSFENWAKMFKLSYLTELKGVEGRQIIELKT